MTQPLDDTDRQLLSLLQANAREGTATLARKLGLARTTVVARIARLEARAEVEEVSAVSGPFDYLVFLRCTSHEQLDALLDKVGQLDGVRQTQTSIVLSRKIDRRSVGA